MRRMRMVRSSTSASEILMSPATTRSPCRGPGRARRRVRCPAAQSLPDRSARFAPTPFARGTSRLTIPATAAGEAPLSIAGRTSSAPADSKHSRPPRPLARQVIAPCIVTGSWPGRTAARLGGAGGADRCGSTAMSRNGKAQPAARPRNSGAKNGRELAGHDHLSDRASGAGPARVVQATCPGADALIRDWRAERFTRLSGFPSSGARQAHPREALRPTGGRQGVADATCCRREPSRGPCRPGDA